jgi:hypothetical protein
VPTGTVFGSLKKRSFWLIGKTAQFEYPAAGVHVAGPHIAKRVIFPLLLKPA